MIPAVLLANSVDRLYIVLHPIHYMANHRKIMTLLMLIAFAIPVISIVTMTTVELIRPPRMVSRACM